VRDKGNDAKVIGAKSNKDVALGFRGRIMIDYNKFGKRTKTRLSVFVEVVVVIVVIVVTDRQTEAGSGLGTSSFHLEHFGSHFCPQIEGGGSFDQIEECVPDGRTDGRTDGQTLI